MSVLRGTFRLSVALAIVALLGSAVFAHFVALNGEQQDVENWHTLQCAQKFLHRDDLGIHVEGYGRVIDVGTSGCSHTRFLATPDEIRAAIGSPRPEGKYGEYFQRLLSILMLPILVGFLLVNLLGVVFLAARGALRWVWAGYR